MVATFARTWVVAIQAKFESMFDVNSPLTTHVLAIVATLKLELNVDYLGADFVPLGDTTNARPTQTATFDFRSLFEGDKLG